MCAPSFRGDPALRDECRSIRWRRQLSATGESWGERRNFSRRVAKLVQREAGRRLRLPKVCAGVVAHPLQDMPGLKSPCPAPKPAPHVADVQKPGTVRHVDLARCRRIPGCPPGSSPGSGGSVPIPLLPLRQDGKEKDL